MNHPPPPCSATQSHTKTKRPECLPQDLGDLPLDGADPDPEASETAPRGTAWKASRVDLILRNVSRDYFIPVGQSILSWFIGETARSGEIYGDVYGYEYMYVLKEKRSLEKICK